MKKKYLFVILVVLIIALVLSIIYLIYNTPGKKIIDNTDNIQINKNEIQFNSLTQKQKLAQMIMVRGDEKDFDFTKLNIGGVFLDRQPRESGYRTWNMKYQYDSKIKIFAATDLEGAWMPKGISKEFPYFSEIKTSEEAYEIGKSHASQLGGLYFNMNFAPVSELSDSAYGGRTFTGSNEEIKEKTASYIQGLQEKVIWGTCKHYPGNALHSNLHLKTSTETITQEDLELFDVCIENNISGIMVSHHVAEGAIDSKGVPSTVSPEVINSLSDFDGLIIADEINMKGLTNFYPDKRELYSLLINAGNDLILDFELNPRELNELLIQLEEDLNFGIISQEQVDNSVKKILEMKGYNVL